LVIVSNNEIITDFDCGDKEMKKELFLKQKRSIFTRLKFKN